MAAAAVLLVLAAMPLLAFVSLRAGEMQIYSIDADGQGERRLTRPPGQNVIPVWSPDGRRIAFVKRQGKDSQIYVMNADGSAAMRLTPSGVHLLPAWSPDGRRIAFISSRAGDLALWVMDPDGRNQRRLAPVAGDFSVLPIFSWKPR